MKKLALVWLVTVILVSGVTVSNTAWSAEPSGFHGPSPGGFHGPPPGGFHEGGFHEGGSHGHHGSHTSFGVFVGAPFFWGPYYYPYLPPVYAPPVYAPPVYVEQAPPVYITQKPYYWYYCPDLNGYYPYVQSCPRGWLRVIPESPPQR